MAFTNEQVQTANVHEVSFQTIPPQSSTPTATTTTDHHRLTRRSRKSRPRSCPAFLQSFSVSIATVLEKDLGNIFLKVKYLLAWKFSQHFPLQQRFTGQCEEENNHWHQQLFLASSMGNAVGSLFSGLGQVVGNILGHPLDFLSGKSCNSVCRPTWDFTCYIENFCVAHLLKFVMVAMLVYFVLLFLYLLYNLGICQCICHTLCRIAWACFATCFSALYFCCSYLCYKLKTVKRTRRRRRRKRDIEEFAAPSNSTSEDEYELEESSIIQQPRNHEHWKSRFNRRRNYKNEHLRRSLRPTTHQAHVEFSGDSVRLHGKRVIKNIGDRNSPLHHHIRVTRSSKFSVKGSRGRNGIHHRRR